MDKLKGIGVAVLVLIIFSLVVGFGHDIVFGDIDRIATEERFDEFVAEDCEVLESQMALCDISTIPSRGGE